MKLEDRIEAARSRMRLLRASDHNAVRSRSAIDCSCDEEIVQQSLKDEVDVNTIVRRFGLNQVGAPRLDGVYGDFTGVSDYHSALARIEAARDSFMSLDPEIREVFNNDPGEFADYAHGMSEDELRESLKLPKAEAPAPAAPPAPTAPVPPAPPTPPTPPAPSAV